MAQPPQACAPCPAHYAVLQGAYARYTNTLIVLERALYLAHSSARTLLVDTQAMFPNNSKITQKYNPGKGVPPQGASFWATCNSAAAHKRCVFSESGKRASVALAYNKPECSGL